MAIQCKIQDAPQNGWDDLGAAERPLSGILTVDFRRRASGWHLWGLYFAIAIWVREKQEIRE